MSYFLSSSIKIQRETELYGFLREMVSVPCFVYHLRDDRFLVVSRSLNELVGIDAPGAGIGFLIKKVHPMDRVRVLEAYVSEITMLIESKRSDFHKLQNLKFVILNRCGEWQKCSVKMDVIGYDQRGVPDRIFGVFDIENAITEDPSELDRRISESFREEEFILPLNKLKYKIAATACKPESRNLLITNRERQIVNLIAEGFCTKQIAEQLGISFHTVETHRKKLFSKFNTHNAAELLHLLISRGIWYHP